MTYRDQLEFRIRKLTRAIDAVGDLPTDVEGVRFLDRLQRQRADLRRTIATGSRSCGECGHPMRQETFSAGVDADGGRGYHVCDSADCSAHRQIVRS